MWLISVLEDFVSSMCHMFSLATSS